MSLLYLCIMTVYIPNNLNIDEILEDYPPQIKPFRKDFLLYVVSLIYHSIIYKKNLLERGEFVPLCSKVLQLIRHDYKSYIDYLKDRDILISDGRYKVDTKCLGYFLNKKYRGGTSEFTLTDKNIIKKLRKQKVEREKEAAKKIPYLKKWFDTNELEIDKENAERILSKKYQRKLTERYKWKPNLIIRLSKKEKAVLALNSWKASINDLHNRNYHFGIDKQGRRLHTNLTTLSRDFRPFLSFNDKPLVHVDLSNSQPYFSLMLLCPEFWETKMFTKWQVMDALRKISNLKIEIAPPQPLPMNFNLLKISSHIKSSIYHTVYDDILMLVKSKEIQYGSEFQKFKDLIKRGELYDYFIEEYKKSFKEQISRDNAKEIVFGILFSENVFYIPAAHPSTQFFYELFPNIASLFFRIKVGNHNTLSLLLQNLESQAILGQVCSTISKQHPNIPLFTIHDSVVTTVGNEFLVAEIMNTELKKLTGVIPPLNIEYWKTGRKVKYSNGLKLQLAGSITYSNDRLVKEEKLFE